MEDTNRKDLQRAIEVSENDFEKKLVYLSAGALTLSMGFVEKIIPLDKAINKWLLITSWSLLASTLLLNLASHLISVRNGNKATEEEDAGIDYHIRIERIVCRNRIMSVLNWISFSLFAFGVLFVVVFCSINMNL